MEELPSKGDRRPMRQPVFGKSRVYGREDEAAAGTKLLTQNLLISSHVKIPTAAMTAPLFGRRKEIGLLARFTQSAEEFRMHRPDLG